MPPPNGRQRPTAWISRTATHGQTFPRSHGTDDALSLVFAPSRVPEMEAERAIEQGGEDVGQKLNYNIGHSQILLKPIRHAR